MRTEMSKTIISIVINLKTRILLAQLGFVVGYGGFFGQGF